MIAKIVPLYNTYLIEPSQELDATNMASESIATERIGAEWPSKVAATSKLPVSTTLTVISADPAASIFPFASLVSMHVTSAVNRTTNPLSVPSSRE